MTAHHDRAATLSAQDKVAIRTALLQRLGVDDEGRQDAIEQLDEVTDVVRDEPTDESELAHQQIASDMQVLLEESDERADRDAEAARALDFSPTDTIAPGAVVGLDGQRYIVGVVVDEVEVSGNSYAGLSTDSPLYQAVAGKKAGEQYTLNDTTGTVDFVA